jgi:hypothetical protein
VVADPVPDPGLPSNVIADAKCNAWVISCNRTLYKSY